MRRTLSRRGIILSGSVFIVLALAATAQESRSEISIQGTGFFIRDSSGNGTSYNTTETGGVLGTYRYHLNRWASVEGAYGYDMNTQKYLASGGDFRIQSGIHQMTGSLVLNLPSRTGSRFNPYVLAGGGALLFDPSGTLTNTISGAQSQTKAAFVYGGGVNFAVTKRISLRAEYRGLIYTAPDFGISSLSTNSITHTAVPSIGFSFRF